jgi:hypothetical protein
MSFKPMIQTVGDHKFYSNNLAFATYEEAEVAAQKTFNSWILAVAWRVDESDQPVNWQIKDGVMEPVS